MLNELMPDELNEYISTMNITKIEIKVKDKQSSQ